MESRRIGTAWGGSLDLEMDDAEGSLRVPLATAPVAFKLFTYFGLAVTLVLLALAEIFRRGAVLEDEQAHVV